LGGDAGEGVGREGCTRDNVQLAKQDMFSGYVMFRNMYKASESAK